MAQISQPFELDENDDKDIVPHGKVLRKQAFDPSVYNVTDKPNPEWKQGAPRTTLELISHLESNKETEIEAKIICKEKDGTRRYRTFNRSEFLENFKKFNAAKLDFKEFDSFSSDADLGASFGSRLIGHDFVPLLSGPFYKQLYYYDYLRMHSLSFHAYHHDAVAKRCVNAIKEFTLGRGFSVSFPDDDDNDSDQALWDGFAIANNLEERFETIVLELLIFGEQFIWWLPNHEINIGFQLPANQRPKQGIIPRIRQIDPSVIWEIVTYPEDIERVLWYQWVAPTQYQIYTGSDNGAVVPGTKFIFQQIPASDVMHVKINCVSDEKRGRSILFPVLGDLKRYRDTIDYKIAAAQKASAYCMDTTIEGSQDDIDAYIAHQNSLGPIPNAGSDFVHTSKVKREYLAGITGGRGGGGEETENAVLSKIAMGLGIPVNYLGGHQATGQNRASAVVATEPVTKTFETYQKVYERILRKMAKRIGCNSVPEITFPELVSQDRSAKIRDIMACERAGYIAKSRAATMGAKELNIGNYDYETEQEEIAKEPAIDPNLLTASGGMGSGGSSSGDSGGGSIGKTEEPGTTKPSAVDGEEKRDIAMRYGS